MREFVAEGSLQQPPVSESRRREEVDATPVRGTGRPPRLPARAHIGVRRRMKHELDASGWRNARLRRELPERGLAQSLNAPALPLLAGGHCDLDRGVVWRPTLERRRSNLGAGKVPRQDLPRRLSRRGEPCRADHAQPHAVPAPSAPKPVAGGGAFDVEQRALEHLPAERPAHRHPEVLPADLGRLEARDEQTAHATRTRAGHDREFAQGLPAPPGRRERALQVGCGDLALPRLVAAALRLGPRGQVDRVGGHGPHGRRTLAVTAARRGVVDVGRAALTRAAPGRSWPAAASSLALVRGAHTWQCVRSQRSNPSSACRPRFRTANVRTTIASAFRASSPLPDAASALTTRDDVLLEAHRRHVVSAALRHPDPDDTAGRAQPVGGDSRRVETGTARSHDHDGACRSVCRRHRDQQPFEAAARHRGSPRLGQRADAALVKRARRAELGSAPQPVEQHAPRLVAGAGPFRSSGERTRASSRSAGIRAPSMPSADARQRHRGQRWRQPQLDERTVERLARSRPATAAKYPLHEWASASAGPIGRPKVRVRAVQRVPVDHEPARADHPRGGSDDAALERGDQRGDLDDGARQDGRAEGDPRGRPTASGPTGVSMIRNAGEAGPRRRLLPGEHGRDQERRHGDAPAATADDRVGIGYSPGMPRNAALSRQISSSAPGAGGRRRSAREP